MSISHSAPRYLLLRQMQQRNGDFLLPSIHTRIVCCTMGVALLRILGFQLSLPWLIGQEFHATRGKLRPRTAAQSPPEPSPKELPSFATECEEVQG